jgi:hypothetical protein
LAAQSDRPRGRHEDAALYWPGNRAAPPDLHADDVIGLPYCVRDYVVDERFGGPAGLAVAREQLQQRGIALILDCVPNHIAADHPWVTDRRECLPAQTIDRLRRIKAAYDPDGLIRSNHPILSEAQTTGGTR